MTLIQRLRNLWKWSEKEPTKSFRDMDFTESLIGETKPKPMATIIKRQVSIDEEVNNILKDEN